ncbi:MAG: hypothetical protein HRT67_00740 [Flavobacteriaceae bacterium]|nr:hypothetical protein [Flavobacteriaceae bacterium]
MFLKRFKDKSNQKYIKKALNSLQVRFGDKKIASVGVLMHSDEFIDYEKCRQLAVSIGVDEREVKFMTFVEAKKNDMASMDDVFSAKDIGWNGKLKKTALQNFVNTDFDALISYYNSSALELQVITASSKANFKIGINSDEDRLFDLMISVVAIKQIDVFKQELQKYLKILNKI